MASRSRIIFMGDYHLHQKITHKLRTNYQDITAGYNCYTFLKRSHTFHIGLSVQILANYSSFLLQFKSL